MTPEARRSDVALALGEGRTRIEGVLEEARVALNGGYAEIDRTLGKLKEVDPAELMARGTILGPVLRWAPDRPERLINLYRERHDRRADRLLIEETATALIEAQGGEDGYAFRDAWNDALTEAALARSPEEQEALSHRSVLDGLASYLDSVERLAGADLLALANPDTTGQDRESIAIARAMAEAEVNRYEAENPR